MNKKYFLASIITFSVALPVWFFATLFNGSSMMGGPGTDVEVSKVMAGVALVVVVASVLYAVVCGLVLLFRKIK